MYTIISAELTAQLQQPIQPKLQSNRSTGAEATTPALELRPRAPGNPWLSPFPNDKSWQTFLTGIIDELASHPESLDIVYKAFQKMEEERR